MHVYIDFLIRHWEFSLLFLFILILIVAFEGYAFFSGPKKLSVQEAVALINHEDAKVIDIRKAAAFHQGHVIHALNLSLEEIDKTNRLDDYEDKPLIIVDDNGQAGLRVVDTLNKKGFTRVKILAGGIRAWVDANLPLEKK